MNHNNPKYQRKLKVLERAIKSFEGKKKALFNDPHTQNFIYEILAGKIVYPYRSPNPLVGYADKDCYDTLAYKFGYEYEHLIKMYQELDLEVPKLSLKHNYVYVNERNELIVVSQTGPGYFYDQHGLPYIQETGHCVEASALNLKYELFELKISGMKIENYAKHFRK